MTSLTWIIAGGLLPGPLERLQRRYFDVFRDMRTIRSK
jgi:hypothetical protein